MNAHLRRVHRRATLALALLVPPALALALASRPEAPDASLPAPLARDLGATDLRFERDDLFGALEIDTRLLAMAGGGLILELAPRIDPQQPDVLVYWSAEDTRDRVPESGRLLGRLAGTAPRRFALPDAARSEAGHIYLWSLGHGALVGSAALDAR